MSYLPNRIRRSTRIVHIVLALLLLGWGTFGVLKNDLLYPGRWNTNFHLSGFPAWLMYAAMLCAAAALLSVVVDHYDRRDNERSYRAFAKKAQRGGWILFAAALIAYLAGVL